MPTSVRLIKASNTPRDPQATDFSLLRGGADAHLVDVLYKLRLAAASNDAAFVMEAADMQREREDFKFSDTVIEQGWTELSWEKMPREVYEGLAVNTKRGAEDRSFGRWSTMGSRHTSN